MASAPETQRQTGLTPEGAWGGGHVRGSRGRGHMGSGRNPRERLTRVMRGHSRHSGVQRLWMAHSELEPGLTWTLCRPTVEAGLPFLRLACVWAGRLLLQDHVSPGLRCGGCDCFLGPDQTRAVTFAPPHPVTCSWT